MQDKKKPEQELSDIAIAAEKIKKQEEVEEKEGESTKEMKTSPDSEAKIYLKLL